MRLHVVYQQDGQIVAAVRLDERSPIAARPAADVDAGHRFAEVEVPTELRHNNLGTLCHRLMVDVDDERVTLKPRLLP